MAHEIETHNGQAAAVFAREDAWHRLGTTLPDCFTAEEAMTHGHLGGWDIRKAPLTAVTESGVIEVPGKFASVRTSPWTGQPEALGVVGEGYTPIQNEDHCEMLNTLVDEGGAHFETAGSLRGGREVFITMKLPEGLMVGGVDPVDLYIAALNSHDGTSAFRLLVTPVRVVCANTQRAALANHRESYTIRHTRNADKAIQQAREGLRLSFDYADAFSAEAERMIQATMTDGQFMDLMTREFGPTEDMSSRAAANAERTVGDLLGIWHSATQTEIIGTRWAAYQTVTEYIDHMIGVRGPKGADENLIRAERVITDPGLSNIKTMAFNLLRVPA